jgi:hypothetical protein
MQTKLIEKNSWRVDTFDSFAEFLERIEKAPVVWPTQEAISNSSSPVGFPNWHGSASLADAIEIARKGWPEGRAALVRELDAARFIQLGAIVKAETLDVAGSYPLVPAAIAGDPLNMFTIGLEHAKTRPIFRFIVNMSLNAMQSATVTLNRGAAILSWIDKLENEGARVEIVLADTGHARRSKTGVVFYSWAFTAKRADEPLELDRMAFCLSHNSVQRRLSFALHEKHADLKNFYSTVGGYGTASDKFPPDIVVPHSVFFGRVTTNTDYATLPDALRTVEKIISSAQQQEDLENAA